MSTPIPFIVSDTNYRLSVPLNGVTYLFDVRWNSRDQAHYFDLREADETPVAIGVKIVLGANLGQRSTHAFFKTNSLRTVDTSGTNADAGYDDLGARIQVLWTPVSDVADTSLLTAT